MPSLTPPPFDVEVLTVLAKLRNTGYSNVTPERIPLLRAHLAGKATDDDELRRGGAIELEEHCAPGLSGAPGVPLLVCTPAGAAAPHPAVYYIHGGGLVAGTNRTTLDAPLDWAEEHGVTVVSVEYRLAPKHPHATPVEDCYAGLVWKPQHAEELGVDPARLIVAGFSAGGGLAEAVALLARVPGAGPR